MECSIRGASCRPIPDANASEINNYNDGKFNNYYGIAHSLGGRGYISGFDKLYCLC